MMKNFLALVIIAAIVSSCSLDDDVNASFAYDIAPIESVSIPDTLQYGEVYDFELTYKRATTCHVFQRFESIKDTNERKIYAINRVYLNDNNCEDLDDEVVTKNLPFQVIREDYYIFKFWQGTNANNEDIFLTKRIPVKVE